MMFRSFDLLFQQHLTLDLSQLAGHTRSPHFLQFLRRRKHGVVALGVLIANHCAELGVYALDASGVEL
jgi:hypothetical protein